MLSPHSLFHDHLTPEEVEFLNAVADFCRNEIAPHAEAWERAEELPRSIFQRAGQLGLMGLTVPRKFGGRGLGYPAFALVILELARHQAALALDVAAHNALCVGHILHDGNAAQLARVFPRLVDGTWLGAWALTEPEAGSDSGGVQTTAVEGDNGVWTLNGFKRYITLGRSADVLVVMAATGQAANGHKEISAFLVEKSQIKPGRKVPTSGMRASETSEFQLVQARAELLGARGAGQQAALACLDKGRIGVAAVSLGLARAALDAATKHALSRRQFGRRLGDFQAIQFMLADSEVEFRAAELLVLQAAVLASKGVRHTTESSVAKLYATEAASRICDRALQIHGGSGYTRDLPVERYWRDARVGTIGEGTSEVQRILISRALLHEAEEQLGAGEKTAHK